MSLVIFNHDVHDMTALEVEVNGVAMETGSTPGAVPACTNRCWESVVVLSGSVSSPSLLPGFLVCGSCVEGLLFGDLLHDADISLPCVKA